CRRGRPPQWPWSRPPRNRRAQSRRAQPRHRTLRYRTPSSRTRRSRLPRLPWHRTRPSRHRTRGASAAHWHDGCAVTAPAGWSAPQWPPARDRVRRSCACRLLFPSSEARLGSVSELQRHVLEGEGRSGRAPRILLEVLDRDRVRVLGEVALGALGLGVDVGGVDTDADVLELGVALERGQDRKSTRLNSSHVSTSYAVFCFNNKN